MNDLKFTTAGDYMKIYNIQEEYSEYVESTNDSVVMTFDQWVEAHKENA